MDERLQKILAQAGYGSRRSCEDLISAGRVKVNGKPAGLGDKADAQTDTISVDGGSIPKRAPFVYVALNKPREVLSDVDPKDDRTTVRDLVPVPGHLFSVGRLDYDSEGLILLTNDGDLANRLTHPRYGHEKEYRVLLENRPDAEQLEIWRRGVVLDDGHRTAPAKVTLEGPSGKGAWLRVILREGRKRQIREVGKQIGLHVERILRLRIGTLLLGELKPGEWRHLTKEEVRKLKIVQEHARPRSTFADKPRRSYAARPARASAEREERPDGERSGPPEADRPRRNPTDRPPRRNPTDRPPRRNPTDRPPRRNPTDRPPRASADRPGRSSSEKPVGSRPAEGSRNKR